MLCVSDWGEGGLVLGCVEGGERVVGGRYGCGARLEEEGGLVEPGLGGGEVGHFYEVRDWVDWCGGGW